MSSKSLEELTGNEPIVANDNPALFYNYEMFAIVRVDVDETIFWYCAAIEEKLPCKDRDYSVQKLVRCIWVGVDYIFQKNNRELENQVKAVRINNFLHLTCKITRE